MGAIRKGFWTEVRKPELRENIILDETTGDGEAGHRQAGRDYVTTPFPNVMYSAEEFQEPPTLTTDIDGYVGTTARSGYPKAISMRNGTRTLKAERYGTGAAGTNPQGSLSAVYQCQIGIDGNRHERPADRYLCGAVTFER